MRYTGGYLWPARPEEAVPPSRLPVLEARGYVADFKMNGSGTVLNITEDRHVRAMNRHRDFHKLWAPSEHTRAAFMDLPGGAYVFWSELMHSKVRGGPRDVNYIHDMPVADGKVLIGTTLAERQKFLRELFQADRLPVSQSGAYWIIDEHTWLARPNTEGFERLYYGLAREPGYPPIIEPGAEGLVLKKARARLAFPGNAKANVSWMVKCRLPTTTLNF